ncbi:hypothetical protein M3223_14745 [Paenibacillus pasadenensis]|uniref:hypothetical protein n=1 Tax=Paenibacillus pasadenensis TaxID=217090 RepID=UPI0020401DEA|nr:hypothetical protein [Paenibacillus pasadenensis]MCM3748607.1 hypothetical protein [Paenibacillus pasadenensis]
MHANQRLSTGVNRRGMAVGLVIVLFILLVISVRIIEASSSTKNSHNNNTIVIMGSKSFDIENRTGIYTLKATALTGDFESPKPQLHNIRPGGKYNFQVKSAAGDQAYVATAYYNAVDDQDNMVGTVIMDMYVLAGSAQLGILTTGTGIGFRNEKPNAVIIKN